jgi:putative two-component system response regulator
MLSPQLIEEKEHNPLILIVDDIEAHAELMEAFLIREGYKVQATTNAQEAIRFTKNLSPDLAILDVMMPGMNGYDLCKSLKSLSGRKFFPIILLTGLDQLENKITGIEAGADDFFSKPFNSIELTTKIRSLIKLKRLQDELDHSEDIILTLAVAIEAKDPYTKGHSERVSNLSKKLALFIGLSQAESIIIKKAATLHDIGKIGLKEDILHKKGPLHKNELELIRRHPIIGEDICKPLHSLKQILPGIRYHHERWDGRGYPDRLKGEDIPIIARIISVIDSFDVIVSERPYRRSYSISAAIHLMNTEKLSGQWDPWLVEKFITMMENDILIHKWE